MSERMILCIVTVHVAALAREEESAGLHLCILLSLQYFLYEVQ